MNSDTIKQIFLFIFSALYSVDIFHTVRVNNTAVQSLNPDYLFLLYF